MTLPPLPPPDIADPGRFGLAWNEATVRAYAQAAVLAEREACALACDAMAEHYCGEEGGVVADHCAFDIRARVD